LTDLDSAVLIIHEPVDAPLDYGARLGRLRWRRALGGGPDLTPAGSAAAQEVLAGGRAAVLLRDARAIPAPLAGASGFFAKRLVPALPVEIADTRVPTLREMEATGFPPGREPDRSRAWIPAVGFDVERFPPRDKEPLSAFAVRLFAEADGTPFDPSFRALVFGDPAARRRPDLTAFLPKDAGRLCDVEALGKDTLAALGRLVRERDDFDVFLFVGVLERLEDPARALALARKAARPGAVLVASVPNVGHLSVVRDLVLGRFDPLPEGLTDVAHLRWFDRRSLAEALQEAGWSVDRVEALPGVAPQDAESLLADFADWPGLDEASLTASEWIAVARAA
jgi:SAM-dependent methyltransferase